MELDIERFDLLRDYLIRTGRVAPGERVALSKLTGGVSNRTVKVTWPDGRGWVLKQALEKLRVEVDWFSRPERIAVESRALRWFNAFEPGSTPAFVFEDEDNDLLAMEYVAEPHRNWKTLLLSGSVDHNHFRQFGAMLGRMHRRSRENAGDVQEQFGDSSHFDALRLEPYYLYTAETVPPAAVFLKTLVEETGRRREALVHGDYSPKNVLIHDGRLVLLDHEVAHFGEPAFDVGFAMAHFLSKAHHLPDVRETIAQSAGTFVETYFDQLPAAWAAELERRCVRHSLGCLLARVAGKSQLEYLSQEEKAYQRKAVLQLITREPVTLTDLIVQFIANIESSSEN